MCMRRSSPVSAVDRGHRRGNAAAVAKANAGARPDLNGNPCIFVNDLKRREAKIPQTCKIRVRDSPVA
jgi:hypothetical protein